MHDDELRALIRESIARHLGPDGRSGVQHGRAGLGDGRAGCPNPAPTSWTSHLSHGRFVFLAPNDPDAPCVVEPQVRCHHCGFCQSYGH